jgi:hypothetical protein
VADISSAEPASCCFAVAKLTQALSVHPQLAALFVDLQQLSEASVFAYCSTMHIDLL